MIGAKTPPIPEPDDQELAKVLASMNVTSDTSQDEKPQSKSQADLSTIKKQALAKLCPIVRKIKLPPEDKFEALLLVIRSSDDESLIQAAYEAAEDITDEAKKAQALLDIIKEIEYFSSQQKSNPA